LDEARKQVSHTLQSCLQSDGSRRYATPPQQISAFNRRSQPETTEQMGPNYFTTNQNVVIGDGVLIMIFFSFRVLNFLCLQVAKLHPMADYSIHFPVKRGELNIHPGVGGSLSAIMHDLETIWSHVIEKLLRIPLKNLPVWFFMRFSVSN